MMIIGLVFIGVVIYYFVKNGEFDKTKCKSGKTAEDILKERYVNGEIDEATYIKMKMTISK